MCILTSVASVPVRAKCYVSRASEDSGRAKIGARAPLLSHFCSLPNFRATRIFTSTRHVSLRSHENASYEGYVYSDLRTRPHVSVFVWKRNFFFEGLVFRQHVSGRNGDRKSNFSKRSSKWRFLEFSCGRRKHDDVSVWCPVKRLRGRLAHDKNRIKKWVENSRTIGIVKVFSWPYTVNPNGGVSNNQLMHEGNSKFPITALAANSNLRRKRSCDQFSPGVRVRVTFDMTQTVPLG